MTESERELLDFEDLHPTHSRTKEALIRERFGCSPARYYQIRNRLADDLAAVKTHPAVFSRMRRASPGLRGMFAASNRHLSPPPHRRLDRK